MPICVHFQNDAEVLYNSVITDKAESHILLGRPQVVIPLYVRFISPKRGFGLFTGAALPKESAAIQEGLRLPTAECIGTYGGRICDKRETIHKKAVYRLTYGMLNPLPQHGR